MLKNYLLIAFRNLVRWKAYSFINIAGLAVGIACCALILLYIYDELSYDRFHAKAEQIYRIKEDIDLDGVEEHSVRTPFPVAQSLHSEYPDIVTTRLFHVEIPLLTRYEEKQFREPRVFIVDSTFFSLFDFRVVAGNRATALDAPNNIVLTEEMQKKYFGNQSAVGKTLRLGAVGSEQDYVVTAVVENIPHNSHFHFDFLLAFSSLDGILPRQFRDNQWWWNPCWTYVLLPPSMNAEHLDKQLPAFVQKFFPEDIRKSIALSLQPLTDIHLYSQRELEIQPNSNILYIYIFSIVALFILFIACINFMNLATARSAKRAREVGIRKALGASRAQVILQFFGESIVISLLAVVLGIMLLLEVLPAFNTFTEKNITSAMLLEPLFLVSLTGILLIVGLVAGSYPALYLSGFAPASVLKGTAGGEKQKFFLRKVLVIGQFALSIIMLIGTGVVYRQMEYMGTRALGFDKEQIIVVDINLAIGQRFPAFKAALLQKPDIAGVSGMTEKIGMGAQIRRFFPEGSASNEALAMASLGVEVDFVSTMGLKLVQGRAFLPADSARGVIINEAAARQLGWDDPLGKRIAVDQGNLPARQCTVVGVVRDFNYASLHQPIEPIVLFVNPFTYIVVRTGDNPSAALASLRSAWSDFSPSEPLSYSFLGSEIDNLYRSEHKLAVIIGVFSIFAVFVACLGLLGLAAFTAEQRRKEIGVRKVMGASVAQIVLLLSSEFTRLVLVALLIAAPVAYLAMSRWLEGFAYRTTVGIDIILVSGIVAILIAWITVSWQSMRAALSNPVRAIKCE